MRILGAISNRIDSLHRTELVTKNVGVTINVGLTKTYALQKSVDVTKIAPMTKDVCLIKKLSRYKNSTPDQKLRKSDSH